MAGSKTATQAGQLLKAQTLKEILERQKLTKRQQTHLVSGGNGLAFAIDHVE